MKYVFLVFSAIVLNTSCKKCATCTYTDEETGVVTTNEICNSPKIFENEKTTYERTGWVCVE
jgi:hypothetical protein